MTCDSYDCIVHWGAVGGMILGDVIRSASAARHPLFRRVDWESPLANASFNHPVQFCSPLVPAFSREAVPLCDLISDPSAVRSPRPESVTYPPPPSQSRMSLTPPPSLFGMPPIGRPAGATGENALFWPAFHFVAACRLP